MKLALSCLALLGLVAVAALARTDIPRKEFKFTPGKIQTYEYRGRLVNGIPKLANQYSGVQVECKVVVQPINDQQIVMKLEDIRVGELPNNHKVDEHYERIDSEKFDGLYNQNKELTVEYQRELIKPIRFTYVQGKVYGFEADVNESEWSVNMKKSILALFQLDLTPSKIIKSSTIKRLQQNSKYDSMNTDVSVIVDPITGERRVSQWTPEEVISQTAEMPLVYPIYEESFQGTCETQYQVDSVENVDSESQQPWTRNNQQQQQQGDYSSSSSDVVLNVTKTINFKNCLTDPSVAWDQHAFGSKTPINSWQQKMQLLQQQRLAQYNAVPEEIKSKYSNVFTSTGARDNVAAAQPIDRYSFIKYNITQNLATGLSVIEGVLAEGKIKYQADGDELVSVSHQKLKLLYVQDEQQQQQQQNLLAKFQQIPQTQVYNTIQCEMTHQKMNSNKYLQDVMRQANLKLKSSSSSSYKSSWNKQQQGTILPPFASSASWFSMVAPEEQQTEEEWSRNWSPERLAKQVEQLLENLVDDVQSEIVDTDTKKAGHRVVQLVHIVANLPKSKLAEIYEQLTSRLPQNWELNGSTTTKDENVFKYKIMRKLFLDSLPLAGSKQCVELIVELIDNKRCTVYEAKELVEAIPQNFRYPDKEIIDSLVRLTQSPFVREHQTLKMSTSIACAKMISSAYARSKDLSFKSTVYEKKLPIHLRDDISSRIIAEEADPRRVQQHQSSIESVQDAAQDAALLLTEQDIIKYVKIFKGMLEKSRNYHDRVTYIETLAHMKVPQVLPVLQPYISGRISLNQCLNSKSYDDELTINQHQRNQYYWQTRNLRNTNDKDSKDWSDKDGKDAEECNFLRTIAIYACAHVARTQPQEVLPIVLPVFENTYEPYQLRIAAFTIATISDIDEHTLERLATQMWREPSKQVASFVVGTLDTLANITHPRMTKLAYVARKACESMPKQYLNTWKYSWFAGGDHYNNEIEQGISWLAESVKSNVSYVPRAGYFHFGRSHGPAAQNMDNKIEFGWTAKGLEQFMEEYLAEEEGSVLATIFQQIFASSEDIEKYYSDVRDTLYYQPSSWYSQQQQQQRIQSTNAWNKRPQHQQQIYQRFGRSVNGEESEKSFGNNKQQSSNKRPKYFKRNHQQQQQFFSRDGQSWESNDEEPKLALFTKLFEQTSYLALDKQQMMKLARDFDEYLNEMGKELLQGGKLTYVKLLMPSSMWQMTPSQIGMPVIVSHRKPIIVSLKIDGTYGATGKQIITPSSAWNKQRWSSYNQQQQQQQPLLNNQQQQLDSLTVFVHPKIIHSSFRFMFAVDQAKKIAYGVATEKSHQASVPMTMSLSYSQPRQLVSFAVAPIFLKNQQDQQQWNQFWAIEVAKTFIGDVTLIHKQVPEQKWLGEERIIRARSTDNIRSPIEVSETSEMRSFERSFNQKFLGLDLVVKGVTDDDEFDWSFNMENKYQHRGSGPFTHYLHILDELMNRPCKYQEVFGYLRPDQAHKQPVYKFEWALQKPLRQQSKLMTMRQGKVVEEQFDQQQQQNWRSVDGAPATYQQQAAQLRHTAVIRDEEQQDKICFSTRPVKRCPKNAAVLDTVVLETPFTCLSTVEYPNLKRWVEEAQEKVLHQMEDMRVTFVRPYPQARMCSPVHL